MTKKMALLRLVEAVREHKRATEVTNEYSSMDEAIRVIARIGYTCKATFDALAEYDKCHTP